MGNDRRVTGSSGDEGVSYTESDEKSLGSNGAVAGPGATGVWSKRKASCRVLVLGFKSSSTSPSPTVGAGVLFAVVGAADATCRCGTSCSASNVRPGSMTDSDAVISAWLTCVACAGEPTSSSLGVTYAALAVPSELLDKFSPPVVLGGGEGPVLIKGHRGDREADVAAGLETEGLRYSRALDMGSSSEGTLTVGVGRRGVP